jgi:(p)ppGpp synthase/HD superfamily hydrolase
LESLEHAFNFAKEAHYNQKRKYTDIPYINHIEETAQLLWNATNGNEPEYVYIAAILHDIVEDTKITIQDIDNEFGSDVSNLVSELTSDKESQNKEGKQNYLTNKINNMSDYAFSIKLSDRLSNVSGLIHNGIPESFVIKYIDETSYILKNIRRNINDTQRYIIMKIEAMILFIKLSLKNKEP